MPNAFNKEEIISRIKQKLDKQNIEWEVKEYKTLTTTKVFMRCELCGEKYENFAHRLSDKICCICNNVPK